MYKTSAIPSAFPFAPLMAPAQELFEEWISYFPTAPLFGVTYRFAGAAANPLDAWVGWGASAPREDTAAPAEKAEIIELVPTRSTAPEAPAEQPASAIADDDIKRIKGIGPKLADELADMGITSLAQIAALTPDDLARIDAALTSITGRCYRDDWVGQAKALIG